MKIFIYIKFLLYKVLRIFDLFASFEFNSSFFSFEAIFIFWTEKNWKEAKVFKSSILISLRHSISAWEFPIDPYLKYKKKKLYKLNDADKHDFSSHQFSNLFFDNVIF